MRFRLSRSLTFWLGLPVLVFLLWAWADSFDWKSRASFRTPTRILTVSSEGSSFSFESIRQVPAAVPYSGEYEPPELPFAPGFDFGRNASFHDQRPLLYAKLRTSAAVYGTIRENALHIPYWMLLIAYLCAWSGLMVWRWIHGRRQPRVDTPGGTADRGGAAVTPSL